VTGRIGRLNTAERRFGHWAMGHVHIAKVNAALLLKYSETATLDRSPAPGAPRWRCSTSWSRARRSSAGAGDPSGATLTDSNETWGIS